MDANALIAYLSREPGADVVESILLDPGSVCLAHGVNVCEVYYQAIRESGEAAAETAISNLVKVGVHTREDFDEAFWKAIGKIKAAHQLSLADAFAVALTQRVKGEPRFERVIPRALRAHAQALYASAPRRADADEG